MDLCFADYEFVHVQSVQLIPWTRHPTWDSLVNARELSPPLWCYQVTEGLPEEEKQTPLDEGEQKEMDSSFSNRYDWVLQPERRLCDQHIGRFQREVLAWRPTFFAASRFPLAANFLKISSSASLVMFWTGCSMNSP